MKLSTKSRYGVRALCRLALLSHDGSAVPLSAISREEKISRQYLGLIFHHLRKSGFVDADRGLNGGYRLTKSPAEISLGSVVRALDGPIAPINCLLPDCEVNGVCERKSKCLSRPAWVLLHRQMESALDAISIESLIQGLDSGDQRR